MKEHIESLEEIEERTLNEDDYGEVPPDDIVSFNELRSCADLYRMKTQGILDIQPIFQREIVWKDPDQTRFIDSLIKSLPIPSMCFALDHKQQKWIVIDGLQRISTIVRFLEGGDWKLSKLDDIDAGIAGRSVAAIKTSDKKLHDYYTRVENLTIPITVLRCDFSKQTHMEYLFTIFHRLNSAGMKLNNQEIRNCIYSGELNDLLKELDSNTAWRRINKMKKKNSYRFTKQEIILRFFAFYSEHSIYAGRLAKFLNAYMHKYRDPDPQFVEEKKQLFERSVRLIDKSIFRGKAPPKLSLTILESILFGVGKNIDFLENETDGRIRGYLKKMESGKEFSEDLLKEGLSGKQRVIDRLNLAARVFSGN